MKKSNLLKENILLKAFGLIKVPLILFSGASIHCFDEEKTIIKIPLNWRTKNHLGSMYFGALCIGADLAAGIYASYLARSSSKRIHLSFKGVTGDFTKRAMSDSYFLVNSHKEIKRFVHEIIQNPNQRMNKTIEIKVSTDPTFQEETKIVAKFELVLSLKSNE